MEIHKLHCTANSRSLIAIRYTCTLYMYTCMYLKHKKVFGLNEYPNGLKLSIVLRSTANLQNKTNKADQIILQRVNRPCH